MKIYVVNLKDSAGRRKIMESQLKRLNLDYEIFDAVNGRDLTMTEIEKYYDMEYFRNKPDYYSWGMAGCTLSHYFLYQKIVADGVQKALILEDDMIINDDLSIILPTLEDKLKPDEVIMLFYQSKSPIHVSISENINEKQRYKLYQVNKLKGLGSTAGYILGIETAKKLSTGLFPISNVPDDWEKFYQRNFLNGIRIVYPFILDNSYAATTINSSFEKVNLKGRLLHLIDEHKIFPIYHLLARRRKKYLMLMRNIRIEKLEPTDFRITK